MELMRRHCWSGWCIKRYVLNSHTLLSPCANLVGNRMLISFHNNRMHIHFTTIGCLFHFITTGSLIISFHNTLFLFLALCRFVSIQTILLTHVGVVKTQVRRETGLYSNIPDSHGHLDLGRKKLVRSSKFPIQFHEHSFSRMIILHVHTEKFH